MAAELAAVCDGCGQTVDPGTGYVHVSHAAIHEYRAAVKTWKEQHPKTPGLGRMLSVTDLMDHPEPVRWRVHHRDCDPEPASNDYWIGVERIDSWKRLVEWTAHLMEKNWLDTTDWAQFLTDARYGHGTRLTPRESVIVR